LPKLEFFNKKLTNPEYTKTMEKFLKFYIDDVENYIEQINEMAILGDEIVDTEVEEELIKSKFLKIHNICEVGIFFIFKSIFLKYDISKMELSN